MVIVVGYFDSAAELNESPIAFKKSAKRCHRA